jgi:hypothetical protein
MSFKDFFKSNHLNKLIISLAVVLVLIFIFSLGILVGHEKERFSRNWGENYYRNIMGPGRPGMMGFDRPNINPHSGLGQIIKIEGNSLIVKDQSNVEKTILVNDQTTIIKNFQNIKLSDLKIDDQIIVIGGPNNQGQIEAKLIRVMPNPAPVMPK